jgi:putative hydrolase of the HAD superfamily
MVEDSSENLFTAKRLGMRTVWITRGHGRPTYVDWRVRKIAELARIVGQLR